MRERVKQLLAMVLSVIMIVPIIITVPVMAADANWTDGLEATTDWDTGNSHDIATAQDLAQLSYNVSAGKTYEGTTFNLTSDIDLSGKLWTPIGSDKLNPADKNLVLEFRGKFDGNNHEISGMEVSGDIQSAGLFGRVQDNVEIRNLILIGTVNVSGNTPMHVGGLVGSMRGNGTIISNCTVKVDVTAAHNTSEGIEETLYIGGVCGFMDGNIENTAHIGNIAANYKYTIVIGGIEGINNRNTNGLICNSYHFGNITTNGAGRGYVGGLNGEHGKSYNCYSAVPVYSLEGQTKDGLFGLSGSPAYSYWLYDNASATVLGTEDGCKYGTYNTSFNHAQGNGTNTGNELTTGNDLTKDCKTLNEALNAWVTSPVGITGGPYRSWGNRIQQENSGNEYPGFSYTVRYDGNGNGSGTPPTDTSCATVYFPDNTGSLAKNGYTFAGWNTKADGTGTHFNAKDKLDIYRDSTFYAQWNKNSSSDDDMDQAVKYIPKAVTLVWENDDIAKRPESVEVELLRNDKVYKTYLLEEKNDWEHIFKNCQEDGEYTVLLSDEPNGYSVSYNQDTLTITAVAEKNSELDTLNHDAYIFGYEDNMMNPESNITRGEVASIFYRLLADNYRKEIETTINPFADTGDKWYANEVSALANGNIIKGYTDGKFGGNLPITRGEFAVIVANFTDEAYDGADKFSDISGHWARKAINLTAEMGWISGYTDGTFAPDSFISRAEAITIFNSALNRNKLNDDSFIANMFVPADNPKDAWYYKAVLEATNSHEYIRDDDGFERWTKLK